MYIEAVADPGGFLGKRSVTKLMARSRHVNVRIRASKTYVHIIIRSVSNVRSDAFIIRNTSVGQSRAKHHAVCDYHVREYRKLARVYTDQFVF